MSQTKKKPITQKVVPQDMTKSPLVQNSHVLAMNKFVRLLEQTQNTLISIAKATDHPRETCFICVSLAMSAMHSIGNPKLMRPIRMLATIQEALRKEIEYDEIKGNKSIIENP